MGRTGGSIDPPGAKKIKQTMYPLKFRPILKTVVWGGEKIAPYKEVVTDQHNIGESWELSGVKGHESVIANGEFEGKTITELVEQFKGKLVGEKVYANTGNEFPLLIKFIDAKSDLSIQVHPDDELAAKRHNSKGNNYLCSRMTLGQYLSIKTIVFQMDLQKFKIHLHQFFYQLEMENGLYQ